MLRKRSRLVIGCGLFLLTSLLTQGNASADLILNTTATDITGTFPQGKNITPGFYAGGSVLSEAYGFVEKTNVHASGVKVDALAPTPGVTIGPDFANNLGGILPDGVYDAVTFFWNPHLLTIPQQNFIHAEFDRSIVAIMYLSQTEQDGDATFGLPDVTYGGVATSRGLEGSGAVPGYLSDQLLLTTQSELLIIFRANVFGDMVRLIFASQPPPVDPPNFPPSTNPPPSVSVPEPGSLVSCAIGGSALVLGVYLRRKKSLLLG